MTSADSLLSSIQMDPQDDLDLRRAATVLERSTLISKLSALTGEPLTHVLKALPKPMVEQIHGAVHNALRQSLDVAMYKLDDLDRFEPGPNSFKAFAGVTGGVSGFFGIPALLIELPVTTTLMLRSFAGIARQEGESLRDPASRLACLEVFALGSGGNDVSGETSYFAARTFLAKTVSEAARSLMEKGLASGTSPVVVELITAIGSRFGVVVSEKIAAGAIPVAGAVGGAAVNLAFMNHFQQIARAHFVVRRLERQYGVSLVRGRYQSYAAAARA